MHVLKLNFSRSYDLVIYIFILIFNFLSSFIYVSIIDKSSDT
jgi:hypothetical protein